MLRVLDIDEYGFGVSWVVDEPLQRACHALAHDGRVWLVDPIDAPEAIERALALGTPAAVVQLLDRHPRDCRALAERLGVPHVRLPAALPDSPFHVFDIVRIPMWHEVGLWWPEHRALVVPEAVGTGPLFRPADGVAAGIHLFLRPRPPKILRRYEPEHLLVGHGRSLHGPQTTAALRSAYDRTWRDLPGVLARLPSAVRSR
jgi:hypothetical protein